MRYTNIGWVSFFCFFFLRAMSSPTSSSSSSYAVAAAAASATAAFHEWKQGGCRYLCAICNALTNGLAPFVAHLASAHGISSAARDGYLRRFGHPRVQTEFVRCRLCARRVIYDHLKLRVHMCRFHDNLDLRTYFDRHVYNKVEVGTNGHDDHSGDGPEEEDGDEEEEEMMVHASGKEEEEDEEEEMMAHAPGKEEEEDEEEIIRPPEQEEKEEMEEEEDDDYGDWVRGCVYECRFCLVRHHRSSDLHDHLIACHRQEADQDSIEDLLCMGTVMQTYTR